ncbi:MAG: hypothetical protein PHC80_08530 [Eubacteriales bacterium]|nr:hypothetical protein [Eubacteriales bacterium]
MKANCSAKLICLLLLALTLVLLVGCQPKNEALPAATEAPVVAEAPVVTEPPADTEAPKPTLADGVYSAEFITDSSMFRVNEANGDKGVLTVANGVMTLHVSLPSKSILNLFVGVAEDAAKDSAALLEPTLDTVTYSDGATEEVNGFDIPVPALDEDFALALIGTKGKWYDHTVCVTNAVPMEAPVA